VEQDDATSQQDAHTLTQQPSDAAPPLADNDDLEQRAIDDYCRLFRDVTTSAECNKLYRDAPELLRKGIYEKYSKTLQGLNKKR
jgi:hypothetical protein